MFRQNAKKCCNKQLLISGVQFRGNMQSSANSGSGS